MAFLSRFLHSSKEKNAYVGRGVSARNKVWGTIRLAFEKAVNRLGITIPWPYRFDAGRLASKGHLWGDSVGCTGIHLSFKLFLCTYVIMDRVEALLRHINGTVIPKRRLSLPCGVRVDDGFFVDPSTGIVLGRCIELSQNENNHFLPIYYYNRSWRFVSLFTQYNIRLIDQGITLQMFERP